MPPSGMLAGESNASISAVWKSNAPSRSIQNARVTPLESALPRCANLRLVTPIESTRKSQILSFSPNRAAVSPADTTLTNNAPRKPSRMNTYEKSKGVPTYHTYLTILSSMDYARLALRDLVRNALLNAWIRREPHQ